MRGSGRIVIGGVEASHDAKWTIEHRRDFVDATAFGDANKRYLVGLQEVSGTFTGLLDDDAIRLFSDADMSTKFMMHVTHPAPWYLRWYYWIKGRQPEDTYGGLAIADYVERVDDSVRGSFRFTGPVTLRVWLTPVQRVKLAIRAAITTLRRPLDERRERERQRVLVEQWHAAVAAAEAKAGHAQAACPDCGGSSFYRDADGEEYNCGCECHGGD